MQEPQQAQAPSAGPNAGACVLPLTGAGASLDAKRVGGKAAPLARAAAEGHAVPAGVVVTAEALAPSFERELRAAIDALGEGPFAVRSSAAHEDGALRSFAGQLETVLSVPRGDVPAAIERCRASASALRALRYSGAGAGPVAVLVQQMVRATAAGVAFSADPRSGERGVVVLEAVRGLGDALVSGAADPECWCSRGERCEQTRGADEPVLSEPQARRVAALARAMEALFGAPQDIEWALEDDALYLLQSRPITALPAAPVPIELEVPPGGWDRDDHHAVLSPLGWAWFQPYPQAMASEMKAIGVPVEKVDVRRIGGQLYMQFVMGGGGGNFVPPRWVLWLASRVIPALRRANRACETMLDEETYMEPLERWEGAWRDEYRREIAALYVADPAGLTDRALLERIKQSLDLSARGLALHAKLGGPGLFSMGKLRLFTERHLGTSGIEVWAALAGSSTKTTEPHRQIEALVREHRGELDAAGGFPRTWAQLAGRCPKLGRALGAWLEANGLRVMHYDPKHSTLAERPEYVLSIAEAAAHAVRSGEEEAEAKPVEPAFLREAERKLTPELQRELRRLFEQARRAYGLRDENGAEVVSRPAGLVRHFVLELGRRIEADLGAREHAVYLYPEEHEKALARALPGVAQLVEKRRGEESWANQHRGPRHYGPPRPPMPDVSAFPSGLARTMKIMGWMEEGEATPEARPGDELPGVGLGSKVVTGKARVVQRPEELAQLRHGEVLVCRITSPEWSVGIARVAAIVTNEGGMLSHPAIIAREYGVTAVLGAADATLRIATGDTIRVDPVRSTVQIVKRAAGNVRAG